MKQWIYLFITLGIAVTGLVTGVVIAPKIQSSFGLPQQQDKTTSATEITKIIREDESITHLVEKTSPSVVSIEISKSVKQLRKSIGFFEEDFGRVGDDVEQRVGGGSGFFVSADGLVVTNRHVIDDVEAEYIVVTQDGKEYPAKIAGTDPVLDIGFLKVEGANFPSLELGDSDQVKIGQTVIAIGNALAEFQNTVTKGIVSGLDRRVEASGSNGEELIEEAIQTDAAINPGNSGGPLLNVEGKVIGINTAVTDGAQSLGFALPSNAIKRAVESMNKYGRIIRPWIGVRYIQVDPDYAKRNNLTVNYGALILRGGIKGADLAVIPGSPADKAGLQENDLLLELNGKKLDLKHPLSSQVSRYSPGDKVTIKLLREGKELEIVVELEERKEMR